MEGSQQTTSISGVGWRNYFMNVPVSSLAERLATWLRGDEMTSDLLNLLEWYEASLRLANAKISRVGNIGMGSPHLRLHTSLRAESSLWAIQIASRISSQTSTGRFTACEFKSAKLVSAFD
jgi:hypothetical protein